MPVLTNGTMLDPTLDPMLLQQAGVPGPATSYPVNGAGEQPSSLSLLQVGMHM